MEKTKAYCTTYFQSEISACQGHFLFKHGKFVASVQNILKASKIINNSKAIIEFGFCKIPKLRKHLYPALVL